MSELVGGFLLPHDPLIAAANEAANPEQRDAVMEAYAHIARRLGDLEVDAVIVIGDDHYTVFGPHCIPRYLIAIGDVEGPIEPWLGIPKAPIKTNPALAQHIMQTGFDNDVDWAVAKSMTMDHSVTIPTHYAIQPNPDIAIVPIYINSGVEPLISSQRCYDIGKIIRKAVDSWTEPARVAVFGTGGISHWVGMADMGRVNEAWDREVLAYVQEGNVQALINMSDAEIVETAGNGALEIKNWIMALGILGENPAELIAYEPIPEWVCGCGFVELKAA